jgi:trk system potassium uptake protein TrkA
MASKSFAVIGLGRFGESVVNEFLSYGVSEILVIDKNREKIAKMSKVVQNAAALDSTDIEALKEIGIGSIDHVIVAIGDDIESSILTTLLLIELKVEKVTVKVQNDYHAKVVTKLGATDIIQPEQQSGKRLAHRVLRENVIDFIDLNDSHSFITLEATEKIIGSTIVNLNFRDRFHINVVAIRRDKDIIIPGPEAQVKENDQLLVVGRNDDIERFSNHLLK